MHRPLALQMSMVNDDHLSLTGSSAGLPLYYIKNTPPRFPFNTIKTVLSRKLFCMVVCEIKFKFVD